MIPHAPGNEDISHGEGLPKGNGTPDMVPASARTFANNRSFIQLVDSQLHRETYQRIHTSTSHSQSIPTPSWTGEKSGAGEEKSGEAGNGEEKSGEAGNGEEKSGEAGNGEEKSGEAGNGGVKSGEAGDEERSGTGEAGIGEENDSMLS
jgi:hypothetical protein